MMTSSEFRQIREQLGLTQERLAAALRTTRVSVARYESGMRRISGAVQVAITQLANRTQIPMAGVVAAGLPIEPVTQSEWVEVPPGMVRRGETFALRVKGESRTGFSRATWSSFANRRRLTTARRSWRS